VTNYLQETIPDAKISQIHFGLKLYKFRTFRLSIIRGEELSETCSFSIQNKFEKFVHLVGIVGDYANFYPLGGSTHLT